MAYNPAPFSIVLGGTNAATAGGTAVDNISGFGSNGYIRRTGTGTYSIDAHPLGVTHGGNGNTIGSLEVFTATYAATTTVDLTTHTAPNEVVDLTLTGNVTLNFTNGTDGQNIHMRIRQDGTGSRIFTAGAAIRFSTDIPSLTLSTTASALDYVTFKWNGTNSKADIMSFNRGF